MFSPSGASGDLVSLPVPAALLERADLGFDQDSVHAKVSGALPLLSKPAARPATCTSLPAAVPNMAHTPVVYLTLTGIHVQNKPINCD